MNNAALIIIDIQNDFCPGGALAVNEGNTIIPLVNRLQTAFATVIATQDWHPPEQVSFASNHKDRGPYSTITIGTTEQVLWPDHCIQSTKGAELHPELDTTRVNLILRKGTDREIDSYSAFYENDKKTVTGLAGYLKALNITDIYLCGLATDFCVFYSAMDAAGLGFNTHVILDATRGINVPAGNIKKTIDIMKQHGIKVIHSNEVFNK